jgi:hypothetical protein
MGDQRSRLAGLDALSQNAVRAILAQKKPATPKGSGLDQRGYVRATSLKRRIAGVDPATK